jgi:N-acetylneuraminate synthase
MRIAGRLIETPWAYLIAEIGINHNGSVGEAQRLIEAAHRAGFDAVKLQKRTPELAVPESQWDVLRDTPWGEMRTIDYRRRIELIEDDYCILRDYARDLGLHFGASAWDAPSVGVLQRVGCDFIKLPSARVKDADLLHAMVETGLPLIASTGMCTWKDVDDLWASIPPECEAALLQCTSGYPVPHEQIALPVIPAMRARYGCTVGYSGHEADLEPTVLAVAHYGAAIVERHITMSRAQKGSDHGASLEPLGMRALVERIRTAEALAMASPEKAVQACEHAQAVRLGRTA